MIIYHLHRYTSVHALRMRSCLHGMHFLLLFFNSFITRWSVRSPDIHFESNIVTNKWGRWNTYFTVNIMSLMVNKQIQMGHMQSSIYCPVRSYICIREKYKKKKKRTNGSIILYCFYLQHSILKIHWTKEKLKIL